MWWSEGGVADRHEPQTAKKTLGVVQALERLPPLDQALHDGVPNWSAVCELTRVATPTLATWTEPFRYPNAAGALACSS